AHARRGERDTVAITIKPEPGIEASSERALIKALLHEFPCLPITGQPLAGFIAQHDNATDRHPVAGALVYCIDEAALSEARSQNLARNRIDVPPVGRKMRNRDIEDGDVTAVRAIVEQMRPLFPHGFECRLAGQMLAAF